MNPYNPLEKNLAREHGFDNSKAEIIDPEKSEKFGDYAKKFYELRKNKGITKEDQMRMHTKCRRWGTQRVEHISA